MICRFVKKNRPICQEESAEWPEGIGQFAGKNWPNCLEESADLLGRGGQITGNNRSIHTYVYIVDMNSVWFETTSHAVITALHMSEVLKESLRACSYVYICTYER